MDKINYGAYKFNGDLYDWKRDDRCDRFMDFVAPTVEHAIAHLCECLDGKEVDRHDFQHFGYVNVEINRESGDVWTEIYCIFPIKVIAS